jgi:hypothetical protein
VWTSRFGGAVSIVAKARTDYKLRTSRDAAAQFLKTFNRGDEAFLVEFGDSVRLGVGFTARTEEIQSALNNAIPPA